jgi:hypothetical protein
MRGRLREWTPHYPILQRMVNQTNFHSRALVVLKRAARAKPIAQGRSRGEGCLYPFGDRNTTEAVLFDG